MIWILIGLRFGFSTLAIVSQNTSQKEEGRHAISILFRFEKLSVHYKANWLIADITRSLQDLDGAL